jgi:hypothetical protein
MSETQKQLRKIKIMIAFEILLILITLSIFVFLQTVFLGFYYVVLIICVISWIVLVYLTLNLYDKIKNRMEAI